MLYLLAGVVADAMPDYSDDLGTLLNFIVWGLILYCVTATIKETRAKRTAVKYAKNIRDMMHSVRKSFDRARTSTHPRTTVKSSHLNSSLCFTKSLDSQPMSGRTHQPRVHHSVSLASSEYTNAIGRPTSIVYRVLYDQTVTDTRTRLDDSAIGYRRRISRTPPTRLWVPSWFKGKRFGPISRLGPWSIITRPRVYIRSTGII